MERTRGALCRLSWPPLPKHAQVPHPPSHRPQPHLVHRPGVLVSPDTRGNNLGSLSQLDLRLSGRVGGRAVGYYLVTTLLAVSLGILLCTTIQPGSEGGEAGREAGHQGGAASGGAADTLLDLLTNCFPPNLVQATMQQYKTVLEDPGQETVEDKETGAMLVPSQPHTWRLAGSWTHSTNILGLVVSSGLLSVVAHHRAVQVFSLATGVSIALSGQEGRPLLAFFQSLSAVMMRVQHRIVCPVYIVWRAGDGLGGPPRPGRRLLPHSRRDPADAECPGGAAETRLVSSCFVTFRHQDFALKPTNKNIIFSAVYQFMGVVALQVPADGDAGDLPARPTGVARHLLPRHPPPSLLLHRQDGPRPRHRLRHGQQQRHPAHHRGQLGAGKQGGVAEWFSLVSCLLLFHFLSFS